jgi:two-component system nitrate/nitrite response regulator NarL
MQYPDVRIVGEASNGLEALQEARTLQPNIILMDANMPKIDGIQATRLIKEELSDVTVIGLTMHDSRAIREAFLQAGAVRVIQKEETALELYQTIRLYGR